MSASAPNATAETEDFEFAALNEARNYREALIKEFGPVLRGSVIEIGAGIGQVTESLRKLGTVTRLLSIEPDAVFAARFRETHPELELIEGTIAQVPPNTTWDGILSINVLEHIDRDQDELIHYASLLRAQRGVLCLLVPARPEIYAPIDKDFGHFRRYTRPELKSKLETAGFKVETLAYYNSLGYFAWWLNFCLLKRRGFEVSKVVFYDRLIFPVVHALESTFLRPPIGQSLLVIARVA